MIKNIMDEGRQERAISSGDAMVVICKDSGSKDFGLKIFSNKNGVECLFGNLKPVELSLYKGIGPKATEPSMFSSGYDSSVISGNSVKCLKELNIKNKITLLLEDTFVPGDDCCFKVQRVVTVNSAVKNYAFNSSFTLSTSRPVEIKNLLWFLPGAWYKMNEYSERSVNYKDRYEFFREDRLSAPLMMCFFQNSKTSFTIARGNLDASTIQRDFSRQMSIDERNRVGSLGVTCLKDRLIMGWWYPAIEGKWRYVDHPEEESMLDLHPMRKGQTHSYDLILRLKNHENFVEAVKDTWRYFYRYYKPKVYPLKLDEIKRSSLDLLNVLCKDLGDATGIPLYVCPRTRYVWNRNLEVGYTGRQLLSAFYLIRAGFNYDKDDSLQKGRKMVDFWVKKAGIGLCHDSYNPDIYSWYDDNLYPSGGVAPPNKVFLRKEAEAHLAVLLAWQEEMMHNCEHPTWENWVKSFGDWLVEHQNSDGSFYRQYYLNNKPAWDEKGDTYIVISFLIELYRATNDRKYLEAAVKAGEFQLNYRIEKFEFAGATLDNPNVYDKEAALLSLEAYLSLYEVLSDQKWLKAAEIAALFAETWVYIWNVPMPVDDPKTEWNSSKSTVGTSLIAVDHSNVDMYTSFNAYEFFRLNQLTKDPHYLDIAKLFLYNTKQMINIDNLLWFAHPGFQQEGWCFSIDRGMKRGYGVSVWLPWVTVAHLHGIFKMEDTYGITNIPAIKDFPDKITPGIVGNSFKHTLHLKAYRPTIKVKTPRNIGCIFLDCISSSEMSIPIKKTRIRKISDNGKEASFIEEENYVRFKVSKGTKHVIKIS